MGHLYCAMSAPYLLPIKRAGKAWGLAPSLDLASWALPNQGPACPLWQGVLNTLSQVSQGEREQVSSQRV